MVWDGMGCFIQIVLLLHFGGVSSDLDGYRGALKREVFVHLLVLSVFPETVSLLQTSM